MWRLVVDMGALDLNSPYAYLLVCTHFAPTSVVAVDRDTGKLAGFVASYRVPDDPDVLFVWQVGVSPTHRKRGIGLKLLRALLDQPGNAGVRHLHATVTPSNAASDRLFRSLAASVDAPCATVEQFPAELFPNPGHEPEVLYQIGPFPPPPMEEVTTKP